MAEQDLSVKTLLQSVRLSPDAPEVAKPQPMIRDNLQTVVEAVSDEERFLRAWRRSSTTWM